MVWGIEGALAEEATAHERRAAGMRLRQGYGARGGLAALPPKT